MAVVSTKVAPVAGARVMGVEYRWESRAPSTPSKSMSVSVLKSAQSWALMLESIKRTQTNTNVF